MTTPANRPAVTIRGAGVLAPPPSDNRPSDNRPSDNRPSDKESELTAPTEPVTPLLDDPPAEPVTDEDDDGEPIPEGPAGAPHGWSSRVRPAGLDPAALGQAGILGVPLVIAAVQGWARRWSTEDAFITFRVVDQFLSGNGPNFNAGERAEAATSPLWMYLLSALKAILGFIPLPWIAVVVGLLLTLTGIALAMAAAARLDRARGRRGWLVPVGAMVFACVPAVWDFTTSGLETGLVFAWLGAAFLALTTRLAGDPQLGPASRPTPTRPWWAPVVIGLGPLIRPDLGVATVVFLGAYLLCSQRSWRQLAESTGLALAMPVIYQVFRMGYYGATVPNTAIAKEAGLTQWGRGLDYLVDFAGPYLLVLPAVLIVLIYLARSRWITSLIQPGRDDNKRGSRSDPLPASSSASTGRTPGNGRGEVHRPLDLVTIAMAPVVSGALLALFVVKVGGDFMHARLLLPAFFCLLLPVASVAVETRRASAAQIAAQVILLVAIGAWCFASFTNLGPDYDGSHLARGVPPPVGPGGYQQALFDTNTGISDERSFWEIFAGRKNPVSLEDYQASAAFTDGDLHRQRSAAGLHYLWTTRFDRQRTLVVDPQIGVVTSLGNIGVFGYNAGNDVWVEDWAGLSDPVGARIELVKTPEGDYVRGRPGHEKMLPEYFTVARWTQPNANEDYDITQARMVLTCGDVAEVVAATNDPMTPGRFLTNLVEAPRLSSVRIPIKPAEGIAKHCSA